MIEHIKHLGKNSAIYVFADFINKAIGFLLMPVYTRYLTPEDFGIVATFNVFVSILTVFYGVNLHGAVTRYYFLYKSEITGLKRYVGTILGFEVIWGIVISLIVLQLNSKIVEYLVVIPFYPYMYMALATAFCSNLYLIRMSLYQAQERSIIYGLMNGLRFLFQIVLSIYLVVWLKQGAWGQIMAGGLSAILFCLIAMWLMKDEVEPAFDRHKLSSSLMFGIPLVPHAMSSWINSSIDKIFMNKYRSVSETGIYSLGSTIGQLMGMLTAAINSAWAPFLFDILTNKGDEGKVIISKITSYYVMFILFIGLVFSMFSSEIVRIMTTTSFYESASIIPIVTLGYIFNGFYFMVVNQIFYVNKTYLIPIITFSNSLFNVILLYYFVPNYGMIGASWSNTITMFFTFALTAYLSKKVLPIDYEYRRIGMTLLAGGITVTGYVYLTGISFSLFFIITGKIMLLFGYVTLLLIFKVFDIQEVCEIVNMKKR